MSAQSLEFEQLAPAARWWQLALAMIAMMAASSPSSDSLKRRQALRTAGCMRRSPFGCLRDLVRSMSGDLQSATG